MISIQNSSLKAVIHPKGAELQQLISLQDNVDFMWNAQPNFWAKHSPILFPIVGSLKNNLYWFEQQEYHLPRHGFARDKTFEVEKQQSDSVTFLLKNDDETFVNYPFAFELRLIYQLVENALRVTYHVTNPADTTLWFSVGGHPAFRVPFSSNETYEAYQLTFNADEELWRWPLSSDGLIEKSPTLVSNTSSLSLHKSLFYEDALVFKHLTSTSIQLHSDTSPYSLQFDFPDFPYLGIWAAKDADFVCLEPWCGIADSVDTNQDITQKDGIVALESHTTFQRTWSVQVQ